MISDDAVLAMEADAIQHVGLCHKTENVQDPQLVMLQKTATFYQGLDSIQKHAALVGMPLQYKSEIDCKKTFQGHETSYVASLW